MEKVVADLVRAVTALIEKAVRALEKVAVAGALPAVSGSSVGEGEWWPAARWSRPRRSDGAVRRYRTPRRTRQNEKCVHFIFNTEAVMIDGRRPVRPFDRPGKE